MSMRTRFTLVLVCVATCLHAPSEPGQQDGPDGLLSQAAQDARQGRYSSAKAEIEAAIALDANQAEAWYQLGLLNGQMGDYRSAEQSFRHALLLDPHSARIHCRLGQTLDAEPGAKEDWPGAVAEFKSALELDPNYAEADSLLGLGLMHLGDLKAAIATLRHVILLDPAQASAHLDLALALEEQQDGDEAVKEYREALALKPDAPETEASLGSLLLRLGRLPEAEQAFRSALKRNPDLQQAHFGLARVLKAQKKTAEAAAELDLAAALEDRKPDADQAIRLNNEALQLASKGDLPGAIADLRQSLLLKPDYGIAKYNLGLVLADSGDLPAARAQLIQAVSLLPGQATIWFDLGRLLAKLGDGRGALEAVSWATRLSPSNPRFAAELKQLGADSSGNGTAGHEPAAARDMLSGKTGPPDFGAKADTAVARVAFARQLQAQSDAAGAMGELLRALVLKPDSLEARNDLAQVYASLSRWDRAVREYRKVLLVAGEDDASAHLALGRVLLRAAHAEEAARHFETVLKLAPQSQAARSGLEEARRGSSKP